MIRYNIWRMAGKDVLFLMGLASMLLTASCSSIDMQQYKEFQVTPSDVLDDTSLSITFLGNTNILFESVDPETGKATRILTDGFFSYPGFWANFFGMTPDRDEIGKTLKMAGINASGALDVIIPLHSHHDHAMDTPEVARLTGAQILGSPSTRRIVEGWVEYNRHAEDAATYQALLASGRFIEAVSGREETYGPFKIKLLRTTHIQTLLDRFCKGGETITEPVIPSKWFCSYKSGAVYALIVNHPESRILITGTAGLPRPDFLQQLAAEEKIDIVMLGIGGIGTKYRKKPGDPEEEYMQKYLVQIAEKVSADVVIPTHWDNILTKPAAPLPGAGGLFGLGSKTKRSLDWTCKTVQAHAGLSLAFLNYAETVTINDIKAMQNSPGKPCPDLGLRP